MVEDKLATYIPYPPAPRISRNHRFLSYQTYVRPGFDLVRGLDGSRQGIGRGGHVMLFYVLSWKSRFDVPSAFSSHLVCYIYTSGGQGARHHSIA